jgi:hypothetical protein
MVDGEDGNDIDALLDDAANVGERYVEIDDACKEPKPWFFDRPSTAVVKEIRDYVAETGESHTWRGHTHTRPEPDALVQYIARFELPEKFRRAKQFLVCPVCRPSSRNFGKREGMIAWFPVEGIIRLIGPDCFAKLNSAAHAEALAELEQRERREKDVAFLLSRRDEHRRSLDSLRIGQSVAKGLDDFGARLRRTLTEMMDIDAWPAVRTGELQIVEEFDDLRVNPRNPADVRTVKSERTVRYGKIDGYKLLDPRAKKLTPRFEVPIATLEHVLAIPDWKTHTEQLSDELRHALVKQLGKALESARALRDEVIDLRSFLSTVNLATLRRWSATPGCRRPIWGRRDNSSLVIGSSETRTMRVPIPDAIDLEIPLPAMS